MSKIINFHDSFKRNRLRNFSVGGEDLVNHQLYTSNFLPLCIVLNFLSRCLENLFQTFCSQLHLQLFIADDNLKIYINLKLCEFDT